MYIGENRICSPSFTAIHQSINRLHLILCLYPINRVQERTGAEDALATTSAVQQVEQAFGVPVVSVVGMSHLTEYMASQEDAVGGVNAQVHAVNCCWTLCCPRCVSCTWLRKRTRTAAGMPSYISYVKCWTL